jgi:hypothetical protein
MGENDTHVEPILALFEEMKFQGSLPSGYLGRQPRPSL